MNWQDVEKLKVEHRYAHAGALAFILGYDDCNYGCHYGMRSGLALAKSEFAIGYNLANRDYNEAMRV